MVPLHFMICDGYKLSLVLLIQETHNSRTLDLQISLESLNGILVLQVLGPKSLAKKRQLLN